MTMRISQIARAFREAALALRGVPFPIVRCDNLGGVLGFAGEVSGVCGVCGVCGLSSVCGWGGIRGGIRGEAIRFDII